MHTVAQQTTTAKTTEKRRHGFHEKPVTLEALARARARHNDFVEQIMPAVKRHARFKFRNIRRERREEMLHEAQCHAWKSFLSCIQRDKEPLYMIGSIALFSVKRVLNYRYLLGSQPINDLFSECSKHARQYKVLTVGSIGFERFRHLF